MSLTVTPDIVHRVGVFAPAAVGGNQYNAFVSTRSQILNQRPELVNC